MLKRAQFNQKVINMTQHEEANRIRMSKRPVSMETRRFAGKCFEQKKMRFFIHFSNDTGYPKLKVAVSNYNDKNLGPLNNFLVGYRYCDIREKGKVL